MSIEQQAADARALLRHLGVERAHVVGHSYGGVIAVQLALDAPALVGSLALLEPGLVLLPSVPSRASFLETVGQLREMNLHGDRVGALDGFMRGVIGPGYRRLLDEGLPAGAFEQALADSDTTFRVELEALGQWSFTADDAARIRQPVLSVVGEKSLAIFHEIHSLVERWIPHAEHVVIPDATHGLQMMNPRAVADSLASWFDRHSL